MKITYVQFNVEHKKKFYKVQMTPQDTFANETRVSIIVTDPNDKTLIAKSAKGRQVICKDTALRIIRELVRPKPQTVK